MVDYVARDAEKWSTVRAESILLINNAIEKIESKLDRHDEWHRDNLEDYIKSSKQNRMAQWAVAVSIAALVATTLLQILHH